MHWILLVATCNYQSMLRVQIGNCLMHHIEISRMKLMFYRFLDSEANLDSGLDSED